MGNSTKDYLSIIVVLVIASIVALVVSQNGQHYKGLPIIAICMTASYFIHWIAFIPSYIARTERFFDIMGTFSYLSLLFLASYLTYSVSGEKLQQRSLLIIGLVAIWAMRLGLFLFFRILKTGEDRRFREAKNSFSKFLVFWTVSAVWVFLTSINALTMIINNSPLFNDPFLYVGLLVWITGFAFEVVADEQKRRFNSDSQNKGLFISSGLWSLSRHPNYFGEILIWVGMAIISFPILLGWQYITLISPVFVILILTRVSGVNLLEERANKKWGELEEYKKYKMETPPLMPLI